METISSFPRAFFLASRFSYDRAADANALFEAAKKQATEENKRILIQETATWCGPCHRLSLFLDRERVWEKDLVLIKSTIAGLAHMNS